MTSDPLAAWEDRALEELDLPSGIRIKVMPSTVAQLIVSGVFPQPLLEAFLADRGDVDGSDDQARIGYDLARAMQEIAAQAVRYIWHDGAWAPVALDLVRYARLPLADRAVIQRVATGTEQITGVSSDELAAFRAAAGGAAPGPDGGAIRPAAVDAHRPNRAARRAGSRPGARGPARHRGA